MDTALATQLVTVGATLSGVVLTMAGEEVLQFLRTELPPLLDDPARRDPASARWRELRTDMRKAYNQVLLLGAAESRELGLQNWRLARNGGNDLLKEIAAGTVTAEELAARVKEISAKLGSQGNRFLEACRADLRIH